MTIPPTVLLFVLILLLSVSPIDADEIPMENVPAYTTAFEANPCCTSCAIIPSASFKLQYCKDHPVTNPAPCICTDPALSIELRSSIWNYCNQNCGASSAPFATSILADYCRLNVGGSITEQTPATRTGTPTQGGTGFATTLTSTSSTLGTGVATTTAKPKKDDDKLSADGRAGVIATCVLGVVGLIVAIAVGVKYDWFSRLKAWIRGPGYQAPELELPDR